MNYLCFSFVVHSLKLKIQVGFACFFIFMLFGFGAVAQVKTQQQKLDSMLLENQRYVKLDTNKVKLTFKILQQYCLIKNFQKAEEYANLVILNSYKLDYRKYAGLSYYKLARLYHGHTDFQKAEDNYRKSIKELLSTDEPDLVAPVYLDLGALYTSIPDYAKSLEANQKAVPIYQRKGNKESLGSCYVNISDIYLALGQHKKALEYLKMALKDFSKPRAIAVVYRGIGLAYFNATPTELLTMDILPSQKLNVALDNLNRSLKIANDAEAEPELIGSIKMYIGLVYEKMGSKDLALNYLSNAIEINKNSDDKKVYAEALQALGNFYNNQKDYTNAVKLLTQALNIAQKSKVLDVERDANLVLSEAYDKLKKYDESLAFYKQYVLVKDEIFDEEKEREITRRQMQLDFGVKEKDYQLKQQITNGVLEQQVLLAKQQQQKLVLRQQELALSDKEKILERLKFLQKQKDLETEKKVQSSDFERAKLLSRNESLEKNRQISAQEQQIKYDGKVKIFLSVAIALILFTAAIIYFNQRKTTRLNKIINKQKRELEQLGRVKDKIFSVVSHDMRTPVNSLISFIQLLEEGNIEQGKLKRYAASLKNNLTYTSSMMENLLNWAASQMQGFNTHLEIINAHTLAVEVLNALQSVADLKHINIENNIDEETQCKADCNMFSLVLRNLISNSIKFTPENGTIKLSNELKAGKLLIIVSDTGVGMTEEQVNHFNNSEYQGAGLSTPGTNKEKGTGLGLMLCRTFMGLMDSKITVSSTKNIGTQFTLWFQTP